MSSLKDKAAIFKKTPTAELCAAFFEASSNDDTEAVLSTLRHHPDILNMQDDSGWTPLHMAVGWCAQDSLRVLLEMGADTHIPDKSGQEPSDLAFQLGYATLAGMIRDIPVERAAHQAAAEKAAICAEVRITTEGLPAPCCVRKHPLKLKR